MKEIIGSLEEWDSILNYYRPNGSSKYWHLNELNILKPPVMWGDCNMFQNNGELFYNFEGIVIPHNLNDYIKFLTEDKINDSNHLYIITVYNPQFFQKNKDIGFSYISEKYKNDIKNGKSKIVILFLFEGYSGSDGNTDFEIAEEWRIKENFPSKSVYFLTGNLIGAEVAKKKNIDIEVVGIQIFDNFNCKYSLDPIVEFEPDSDKYLFLSYNREPRYHRIDLAYEMYRKNILYKGLFSLGKPSSNVYSFLNNSLFEKNIIDELISKTPFLIENDLKYNLAVDISINDYKKTFISIITETIISNGTLFISEKTWKPIIVGHPFIIYGNFNTLSYLKSIGYKTFDKWIDESYDLEKNENRRLSIIVKEICRFQKMPIIELKKLREEMSEVCIYNKNHYIELLKKNWIIKAKDSSWIGDLNNILVENLTNIWRTFDNDYIFKKNQYSTISREYKNVDKRLV